MDHQVLPFVTRPRSFSTQLTKKGMKKGGIYSYCMVILKIRGCKEGGAGGGMDVVVCFHWLQRRLPTTCYYCHAQYVSRDLLEFCWEKEEGGGGKIAIWIMMMGFGRANHCHFAILRRRKGSIEVRNYAECVSVHTIDTGVILSVSREELLVVGICRRVDLELHWINYWNVVDNVVVLIWLSKPKIFCN